MHQHTRSSTINNFSNGSVCSRSEIEIHKPVTKVDSGIEQDAPPLGKKEYMDGYLG